MYPETYRTSLTPTIALLQRRDLFEGLALAGQLPIIQKLLLMELEPFENVTQSPLRKRARNHAVQDPDGDIVLAVGSMEMRGGYAPCRVSRSRYRGTLRNWEQGRRRPEGTARVLLQVVAKHPEAVLDAVRPRESRAFYQSLQRTSPLNSTR